MDFWQTILLIAGGAVTLGGVIYGAIGGRNKAELELLRRMNSDLRLSNEDYKKKIDELTVTNATLLTRVESLENEKKLPLETLTALVVKNDKAQLKALTDIAKALKVHTPSEGEE